VVVAGSAYAILKRLVALEGAERSREIVLGRHLAVRAWVDAGHQRNDARVGSVSRESRGLVGHGHRLIEVGRFRRTSSAAVEIETGDE